MASILELYIMKFSMTDPISPKPIIWEYVIMVYFQRFRLIVSKNKKSGEVGYLCVSKIWILINHKVWHPFWSYTSWSSPWLIPFPLAPWRGNWLDSSSKCLGSLWGKVWCAEVSETVLCTLVTLLFYKNFSIKEYALSNVAFQCF